MITAVVPSTSAARTRGLLASMAAQTLEHRTVVVDNGSPGGAVSEVCRGFDRAEAVRSEVNLGFSRAVNLGARRADGEAIVVVNDDAVYDPDFLERIVAPLDPAREVRMVAGAMRSTADAAVLDTAGVEVDHTLLAYDHLQGRPVAELESAPAPFGPSGVAAAFERKAFESLGGFDERIFAYLEDVDLALRMRLAGSRCAIVTETLGEHGHSSTLGSGSPDKDRLMGFSRGYLLRKWSVASPRRVAGVALRELIVCGGQAVVDRTFAGVAGRREGWRAATAPLPYPAELLEREATLGFVTALGRRARRSGRMRRSP